MTPLPAIARFLGHPGMVIVLFFAVGMDFLASCGRTCCGFRHDALTIRRAADQSLQVVDLLADGVDSMIEMDNPNSIAHVWYRPDVSTTMFCRTERRQLQITPLNSALLDPPTLAAIHREVGNWMASSPNAYWPWDAPIIAKGGDYKVMLDLSRLPHDVFVYGTPIAFFASLPCLLFRVCTEKPARPPSSVACPNCGYPTAGLPTTICPECGHDCSLDAPPPSSA